MTPDHLPTVSYPPHSPHAADITVFTPYFAARTPERQAELDLCLRMNLQCDAVTQLVLLVDDGHQPPLTHSKLTVRAMPARPTYLQWIELNAELSPGGVSILANSDIYFDDSLHRVHETLAAPQRFIALSRFEKLGNEFKPHPTPRWSQDVWGLRTGQALPVPLLKALDVPLGVPRCDNKIAYLFAVHGWTVHNPMAFVRSVHVHETQQRNYDKKTDMTVMGGVAYVDPSEALEAPSTLEFDVWARHTRLVKSVKLNRSMDSWAQEALQPAAEQPAKATDVRCPVTVSAAPATLPLAALPGVLGEKHRFMASGPPVFDFLKRFVVYRLGGELLAFDWMNPQSVNRQRVAGSIGAGAVPPETVLALLIPPRLDTHPVVVGERPLSAEDCNFWQYPCSTEQQAYDNHQRFGPGSNVDAASRTVNTYLGLPWATYVDKKSFPDEVQRVLAPRVRVLALLAEHLGYRLAVHTVCQQIYWRRLIEKFHDLGVTDLHLSHAELGLDPAAEGWKFRIHSWPLIAPNVEVKSRSAGLVFGKPIKEKRYFASFIGAHMPHYRSDVRLRLLEAAKASGRDDVVVDLGAEWHFNKIVYKEQVQNKPLSSVELEVQSTTNYRYNEVLSDTAFSLCPEGAGPNTLRVWESMAVGSIPVIIGQGWLPPTLLNSDLSMQDCCIFLDPSSLPNIFEVLSHLSVDEQVRMQENCIRLYAAVRNRQAFFVR